MVRGPSKAFAADDMIDHGSAARVSDDAVIHRLSYIDCEPEEFMRTVSIRLPDALEANLSKLARRKGLSKSAVVQEALTAYMAGTNGPQARSWLDLARSLWGSLEGPSDLSCNKKYLEGYGQ